MLAAAGACRWVSPLEQPGCRRLGYIFSLLSLLLLLVVLLLTMALMIAIRVKFLLILAVDCYTSDY